MPKVMKFERLFPGGGTRALYGSSLFLLDLLTDHELKPCKSLEIKKGVFRFMESLLVLGTCIANQEPRQRLGVRQSSGALGNALRCRESARGLAQSKTFGSWKAERPAATTRDRRF